VVEGGTSELSSKEIVKGSRDLALAKASAIEIRKCWTGCGEVVKRKVGRLAACAFVELFF
jgi:hypothetical protein